MSDRDLTHAIEDGAMNATVAALLTMSIIALILEVAGRHLRLPMLRQLALFQALGVALAWLLFAATRAALG
ncbi:hypothetical protein ACFXG4_08480 [Nocardia sp. NPDC059246]|uniref:hypothetical protein n=1 Tax=unclassified Nocardia TaxID=2637762 RepID=UPI0036BE6954